MRRQPLSLPHVDTGAFHFGPAGPRPWDVSHLSEADILAQLEKLGGDLLRMYREAAPGLEREEAREFLEKVVMLAHDMEAAPAFIEAMTEDERAAFGCR